MADCCSSRSSEEEHAILLGALAVLQQIDDEEKLKKRQKWWFRPRIARRQQFGAFHALMKDIKMEDPRAFANFVRMDAQQFQYLLDAVSPLVVHKDKAMLDAIPPAERLAVTLRFLATNSLDLVATLILVHVAKLLTYLRTNAFFM